MDFYPVSLILLVSCCILAYSAPSTDPANPKSDISINCGSAGTSSAANGREWIGDTHSKIASLLTIGGTSTRSSSAKRSVSSTDLVVHETTRISHSPFSYTFHLNPGLKILRLHFYANQYNGFTSFQDFFTVEAAQFTLLENFSASLTSQDLDEKFFTKEFYINTKQNQPLNLVFSPSISPYRSYAFINGIEITTLPSHLTYFRGRDLQAQVVGQKSHIYVDNSSALELVHSVHVKQEPVLKEHERDTFGMWSKVPKEKANGISELTWTRLVDVGYKYLVRVHFTKLGLKIAETGHVMFRVFINGITVDTSTDIVQERDGLMLQYRDYVVVMKGRKQDGRQKLLIALQQSNNVEGYDLLKGFEVLKVSNTDNSLASPNPSSPERYVPSWFRSKFLSHRVVIEIGLMTLVALASIIAHRLRMITEADCGAGENKPSPRAQRHCSRFPLAEIESATRNFSDALLIGRGGFGKVYKGQIDNGTVTVAIKRRSRLYSMQGSHEFWTEIETLSELRHINLVSLIGYCNDYREMILVYEYMRYGTLADHLYKLVRKTGNKSSLTWKQRLEICIGAGRGLDYLHTGHKVIHRDVKTSNILLDNNYIAKVSDFGLAKPVDRSRSLSHVSTNVKGTAGYFDPYYMNTRKLSRKSDTYAFGVVLLEVLCGKPAMDRKAGEDECLLTKWAWNKIDKGEVLEIVDSSLIMEISPDSLKAFVEVARSCLHDEPKERPTMDQVVVRLKFALDLQEKRNVSLRNRGTRLADGAKRLVGTKEARLVHLDVLPNIRTSSSEPSNANEDEQLQIDTPVHLWPWSDLWNRIKPYDKKDIGPKTLPEICEAEANLWKFDFASIAEATNQFSCSNKIGQGGFGAVYKAVLSTGQTLAVKRLSPSSMQGLTGFRNEILLSSNLHHHSIMNLLGYCILGDETMLIYEFMAKGSLDSYIYDEYGRRMLHWALRFKIILGIGEGIVHLHQDSRMQIIHRDIKPSNILLDNEMNPKISDFGLALIIKDDQTVLETELAGTLGYLAPEVKTQEGVSVMSEVYSFGALVLEIVSGKKILSRRHHLVRYAWEVWNKGKALDLVDESLSRSFSAEEALRCIQVGLLCTQKQPRHRPTMVSVLQMLSGEESSMDLHEKVVHAAIADDVQSDALGDSYLFVDTENLSNEAEGVPGPPNSIMFIGT